LTTVDCGFSSNDSEVDVWATTRNCYDVNSGLLRLWTLRLWNSRNACICRGLGYELWTRTSSVDCVDAVWPTWNSYECGFWTTTLERLGVSDAADDGNCGLWISGGWNGLVDTSLYNNGNNVWISSASGLECGQCGWTMWTRDDCGLWCERGLWTGRAERRGTSTIVDSGLRRLWIRVQAWTVDAGWTTWNRYDCGCSTTTGTTATTRTADRGRGCRLDDVEPLRSWILTSTDRGLWILDDDRATATTRTVDRGRGCRLDDVESRRVWILNYDAGQGRWTSDGPTPTRTVFDELRSTLTSNLSLLSWDDGISISRLASHDLTFLCAGFPLASKERPIRRFPTLVPPFDLGLRLIPISTSLGSTKTYL